MKRGFKASKTGVDDLEAANQSVSVTSSAQATPAPSAAAPNLLSEKTSSAGGGSPSLLATTSSSGSSASSPSSDLGGASKIAAPTVSDSTPFRFGGENFFAKPAAFGGAPSTGDALTTKPDFVPGELIIRFAPADSLQGQALGIQKALAAVGGNVLEWLVSANNGDGSVAFRVSVDNAIGLERAIQVLSNMPGVQAAEYNWIHTVQAISNDPGYTGGSLWGAYGDASPTKTNQYGSQAAELWAKGYTGSMSTVLGVIDEGIDFTHPDLYLNIWLNQGEIRELSFYDQLLALERGLDNDGIITFRDLNAKTAGGQWVFGSYVTDINNNGRIDADDLLRDTRWANGKDSSYDSNGYIDDLVGWDFVGNDNRPFDGSADDHGTHVAGTIGAIGGNGVGIAGVNWEIQMMALKFLGASGGSIANAINAVNYYTNMALDAARYDWWNGNYVGTTNSWGGGGYSSTLLNAIINAARADLFFIAAAGNSSSNNDVTASYPSGYSTFSALGWEAVVAVASITSTGALSSFSSYGSTTVDLGAPGSSIYSTLPGNTYGTYSGTSMATPHVSGALALLASIYPTATAAQLLSMLFAAVAPTTSLNDKTLYDGRLDLSTVALPSGDVTPPADTTPPTLTITMSDTALTAGETAIVTFAFSEAVKNFDLTDVTIDTVVGTIAGLTSSDQITWTATYTPNTNVSDSTNVISVAAGSYQDLANNAGAGATSANFMVNTLVSGGSFYGTTGSDTVTGSSYNDTISGIPATGLSLGKGTVDYLYGSGGNDLFILGDTRGVFYDDGNSKTAGNGDYAAIMDFNSGDRVQLKDGSYFLVNGTFNGAAGTGIYWDTNSSRSFDSKDEFVGVIYGVATGSLQIVNGAGAEIGYKYVVSTA